MRRFICYARSISKSIYAVHAVQLCRSTFIAHYLYFVFSVEGACYCLALHRSYNWPCCPLWWVAHTLSDPYHISTRFWNAIIMHASLRSEIDYVKWKEFGHMLQKDWLTMRKKNIPIFNKILKNTGLIVFYKAMPLQQRLHSLGHWSLIVTALTRSWSVVQILGGVQTLAILNTSTSTSILVLLLILLKLLLLLLLLILPDLKVLLLLLFALPLYLLGEGEQRLL